MILAEDKTLLLSQIKAFYEIYKTVLFIATVSVQVTANVSFTAVLMLYIFNGIYATFWLQLITVSFALTQNSARESYDEYIHFIQKKTHMLLNSILRGKMLMWN